MEKQNTIYDEEVENVKAGETKAVPAGAPGMFEAEMPQDIVNESLVKKELNNIATTKSLIKSQLVEKVDYGIIPGCGQKPSLFKPGAEKIIRIFHVSIEYKDVNPIFDMKEGNVSHTILCSAYFNGVLVQQGVGSANCFERKFWRNSIRDRLGIDNTILKMAKKRALVDVALQLGSLSNTFTQDVEDFQEVIKEDNDRAKKRSVQMKRESIKNDIKEQLNATITKEQQKQLFELAKQSGKDSTSVGAIVRKAMTAVGHGPSDSTATIAQVEYQEIVDIINKEVSKSKAESVEPLEVEE